MSKSGGTPRRTVVRRPSQIRALKSGVRQEILDTVLSAGPCSVRELAERLGRPSDSLYYHVRMLAGAGLLRPGRVRRRDGRRERVYAAPWRKAELGYDPEDTRNRRAVTELASSMLRMASRDFRRGFRPDLASAEGPSRNLWAARMVTWLSPGETKRVNALLQKLRSIFEETRNPSHRRLCALTWVLCPLEPRPPRR